MFDLLIFASCGRIGVWFFHCLRRFVVVGCSCRFVRFCFCVLLRFSGCLSFGLSGCCLSVLLVMSRYWLVDNDGGDTSLS